jgi:dTDP-4-amino-4,6-dideoxygalactose transaminase
MNAAGVGTSIYYPQPVPRMGYYRGRYGWTDGAYPVAAELSDASVALPVGPHVSDADAARVAAALVAAVTERA